MIDHPHTDGARIDGSDAPDDVAENHRRHGADKVLFTVALVVIVLDQLTKLWATRALDDGPIDVVWTLRFNLVGNTGAAFSRGEGLGPVLGIVIIIVISAMVVYRSRIRPGWPTFAFGLILGGAVGNVLDRLFRDEGWLRGAVVDFIDFQWYPVFNVADMGVVIGGLLLLFFSYLDGRHQDSR